MLISRSHLASILLALTVAAFLSGCIFEGNPGGPFM